jgi:putative Mg2+ transporter-C (MgtC) family protein
MLDIDLPSWEIGVRLASAALGGAALGWERERRAKPAGLRTNMLVSVGAAAFTLITIELYREAIATNAGVPIDPSRTVAGIIGGIGFLGAGSIIQSRGEVKGVTTAAAIWVCGAIGVACGSGYYLIGSITVVFALLILAVVGYAEHRIRLAKPKGGIDRNDTDAD